MNKKTIVNDIMEARFDRPPRWQLRWGHVIIAWPDGELTITPVDEWIEMWGDE